jgi:hypothetical protein
MGGSVPYFKLSKRSLTVAIMSTFTITIGSAKAKGPRQGNAKGGKSEKKENELSTVYDGDKLNQIKSSFKDVKTAADVAVNPSNKTVNSIVFGGKTAIAACYEGGRAVEGGTSALIDETMYHMASLKLPAEAAAAKWRAKNPDKVAAALKEADARGITRITRALAAVKSG